MTGFKSGYSYNLQEALSIRGVYCFPVSCYQLNNFLKSDVVNTTYIIRDKAGVPIGYVVYALVSKDGLNFVVRRNAPPKYSYEWSEGRILLIVDVCFLPHRGREACYELKKFVSQYYSFCFFRRGEFKLFIKRFGFFRKSFIKGKKWITKMARQKYLL